MLKFLLLFFLFVYLFFRIGGYFLRILLGGAGSARENREAYKTKPKDGNVFIEREPSKGKDEKKKGFEGGEYVDYEEVD